MGQEILRRKKIFSAIFVNSGQANFRGELNSVFLLFLNVFFRHNVAGFLKSSSAM